MKLHLSFSCPMKWSEMQGDDAVRHCSSCDKQVTSLSNLAPAAARTLVARSGGELCVSAVVNRRTGHVVHGARAAAFMAGLAASPVALADGQIPDLTAPTTDPATTVAITDPAPADPELVQDPVLVDVEDTDCAGNTAGGVEPVLQAEEVPHPDPDDFLMIAGGI